VKSRPYTTREEIANAVTHGAGVIGGLVGAKLLLVVAACAGAMAVLGAWVFAVSLILMYGASTLYHSVQHPRLKSWLRLVDHCAIYVFIAGTYTPFTLLGLRGAWGWSLFGVIWGLAVAGVVFKLFWIGRFPRVSTAIYLAMGWLIVVAAVPTIRALSPSILVWLFVGGMAYTVGTYFYHNERIPYAHAIWHLFVLAGSVSHAIAVGIQVSGG
jgi:hemolysin III